MNTNEKFLLIVCLIVVFLLIGCISSPTETPTIVPAATLPIVPTPLERPGYLVGYAPRGVTKISDYVSSLDEITPTDRGVIVAIDKSKLCVAEGDDRYPYCGSERINIYVDNQLISNDTLKVGQGGYFYYSWAIELGAGMHTVRFTFTIDSGEILEYSWQFYLTED